MGGQADQNAEAGLPREGAAMRARLLVTFLTCLACLMRPLGAAPPEPSDRQRSEPPSPGEGPARLAFRMSPAVACRSIAGFEDFTPLPDASLTSDQKLLIYYRPFDYHVERKGQSFRARLSQDGQVRRRGQKAVLFKKKLVDEEFKTEGYPPSSIYMMNTIALKGLKPGEYDVDIILHDELAKGTEATQTLHFRIVPNGPSAGSDVPSEPRATPAP